MICFDGQDYCGVIKYSERVIPTRSQSPPPIPAEPNRPAVAAEGGATTQEEYLLPLATTVRPMLMHTITQNT